MNLDITQDNLYLLLPSKVSRVSEMLSEDSGADIVSTIRQIYSSNMYRKLEQEETKMWHLGPVTLYDEFMGKA